MAKVIRKPGPGAAKLEALLKNLQDAHARAGWTEQTVYPDSNTPAAYVAVIQENGVPEKNIPPRPFLAPTVAENQGKWAQMAGDLAQKVLKGELTVKQLIAALGLEAVKDIQAAIRNVTSPQLHATTVLARIRKQATDRGSKVFGKIANLTKPLQETNFLHDNVKSEVNDGKAPAEWIK